MLHENQLKFPNRQEDMDAFLSGLANEKSKILIELLQAPKRE